MFAPPPGTPLSPASMPRFLSLCALTLALVASGCTSLLSNPYGPAQAPPPVSGLAVDAVTFTSPLPPERVFAAAERLFSDYGAPVGLNDTYTGTMQTDYTSLGAIQLATEGAGAPTAAFLDNALLRYTVSTRLTRQGTVVTVQATQRPLGPGTPLRYTPMRYWLDRYASDLASEVATHYNARISDNAYLSVVNGGPDLLSDAPQAAPSGAETVRRNLVTRGLIIVGGLAVLIVAATLGSGAL